MDTISLISFVQLGRCPLDEEVGYELGRLWETLVKANMKGGRRPHPDRPIEAIWGELAGNPFYIDFSWRGVRGSLNSAGFINNL